MSPPDPKRSEADIVDTEPLLLIGGLGGTTGSADGSAGTSPKRSDIRLAALSLGLSTALTAPAVGEVVTSSNSLSSLDYQKGCGW